MDGNNVMGAAPDGWSRDRVGAAVRLAEQVALWCRSHEDAVTLVFDGAAQPRLQQVSEANLHIAFAERRGRDAADDRIVELVAGHDGVGPLVVVTSDRGLRARLPGSATTEGAGAFRQRIGMTTRR